MNDVDDVIRRFSPHDPALFADPYQFSPERFRGPDDEPVDEWAEPVSP